MRIGLNLLYLLPGIVGGTETYASGLLHGLSEIDQYDEFTVFVNRESANWPLPNARNFTRVVCPVSAVSRTRRYLFEQFRLPGLLRECNVDIVHSLGYVSPLSTLCPSIVSVPDLNYLAFGNEMSISRRLTLNFFVKQSMFRAKHIITISNFSRTQIVKSLHLSPSRVSVTYLAPCLRGKPLGSEKVLVATKRLGVRSPHIIAFSSGSPNKNIPRLLRGFARAREHGGLLHQLVLVGHQPVDEILPPLGQAVQFTGYLDDDSLMAVLCGAQMLVFPSIYEGFGLPVVEAMACGVPVVCSDQASLPEVAGEAAVFFNPFSVEDMAQKIAQVASNPGLRAELRQKGFENVKRFSWTETARETLGVYEQVYHNRRWA